MTGATAEPWVKITTMVNKANTTMIGMSNHNLRFHRKTSNLPSVPKRVKTPPCDFFDISNTSIKTSVAHKKLPLLARYQMVALRSHFVDIISPNPSTDNNFSEQGFRGGLHAPAGNHETESSASTSLFREPPKHRCLFLHYLKDLKRRYHSQDITKRPPYPSDLLPPLTCTGFFFSQNRR